VTADSSEPRIVLYWLKRSIAANEAIFLWLLP